MLLHMFTEHADKFFPQFVARSLSLSLVADLGNDDEDACLFISRDIFRAVFRSSVPIYIRG